MKINDEFRKQAQEIVDCLRNMETYEMCMTVGACPWDGDGPCYGTTDGCALLRAANLIEYLVSKLGNWRTTKEALNDLDTIKQSRPKGQRGG